MSAMLSCLLTTLPAAAEPRIPAFARFHAQKSPNLAEAGRLLIGELNCHACHKQTNPQPQTGPIIGRRAPRLTDIGSRVSPAFLREYLSNPGHFKPGLTMPDVLHGRPDRGAIVEALVHFLASTGTHQPTAPQPAAAQKGEKLFHQLGCTACHDARTPDAVPLPTSVPLGHPERKYSINSLARFLKDPVSVRPSGRMPSLNLSDQESRDLANYFLKDIRVPANIRYQVYRGHWDKLPDFAALKPTAQGQASSLDLGVAGTKTDFGIRFTGFLQIPRDGKYKFLLGSDDGGRLRVDGDVVVDVDGIHPYQQREVQRELTQGSHRVEIDFFQQGGEWVLKAELSGPDFPRRPLSAAMTLEPNPRPNPDAFRLDPQLARRGQQLFGQMGCAACHEIRADQAQTASQLSAPAWNTMKPQGGCLATRPAPGVPNFQLNATQRTAITAAFKTPDQLVGKPRAAADIQHTMQAFNCYACHSRRGFGGVEQKRNAWFQGTVPEMGDEGRLPPLLDDVGDKLTSKWLQHVLTNGANDRPYMSTRMPKFQLPDVAGLAAKFATLDLRPPVEPVASTHPEYRMKSAGRHMVGDKALSCVKCHNFGGRKGTGLQSLDLLTMTDRLRRDWYLRYMINPQAFRPGTRMPSAWPAGNSILPKVLDGDTQQQLAAIWRYLSDGSQARVPSGFAGRMIELKPDKHPLIYRNFIQGLSPRGIAVGYPERVHLAFDAEQMSLRLIWHGAFIDASKHWVGRGPGAQSVLGDDLFDLRSNAPFAFLETAETAWPKTSARQQGFRFRGYRLDENQRPAFRYTFGKVAVTDFPVPAEGRTGMGLKRTLTLQGQPSQDGLWFRAAVAKRIRADESEWFVIDQGLRIRHPGANARVRRSGDMFELLIPVVFADGRAQLIQELDW